MNPILFGGVVSLALLGFGVWLKWRLTRATNDRIARDQAEQQSKALKAEVKGLYEQNQRHENNVVEIMRGVSDARASELLSSPPKARASSPLCSGSGAGRG